jgi:hypothetical protein
VVMRGARPLLFYSLLLYKPSRTTITRPIMCHAHRPACCLSSVWSTSPLSSPLYVGAWRAKPCLHSMFGFEILSTGGCQISDEDSSLHTGNMLSLTFIAFHPLQNVEFQLSQAYFLTLCTTTLTLALSQSFPHTCCSVPGPTYIYTQTYRLSSSEVDEAEPLQLLTAATLASRVVLQGRPLLSSLFFKNTSVTAKDAAAIRRSIKKSVTPIKATKWPQTKTAT